MAEIDRVDLTDDAARELGFLTSHLEEAEQIVRESRARPAPSNFKELYQQLPAGLAKNARRIVRSLLNIHEFTQESRITAQEAFDLVTDALDSLKQEVWGDVARTEWTNARSRLTGILSEIDDTHPFSIIQKASDLTYAHEKLLRDARIITDVRPVFRGDSEEITRGVVVHKLQIEYTSAGARHKVELALDAADVAALRKTCQRAEAKAAAIRKSLSSAWLVVIPREKSAE